MRPNAHQDFVFQFSPSKHCLRAVHCIAPTVAEVRLRPPAQPWCRLAAAASASISFRAACWTWLLSE